LVAQALPGFGQTIEDARRVQASVLGVDSHNDTMQRVLIENVDLGQRLPDGMVDLPQLREGGMHVAFFALWVPAYYPGSEAVRRTLDLRDAAQRVFDKYPEQVEMATSARDIQRIVGQKKIAAVLAIEGGHQIDNDLAVLRMYRRMGILSTAFLPFRSGSRMCRRCRT
jgi:membrane dipeptidase